MLAENLRNLIEENFEGLRCRFCDNLKPTLIYTIEDFFCNYKRNKYQENFMTPNFDRQKYVEGGWELINKEIQEIKKIKINNKKLRGSLQDKSD